VWGTIKGLGTLVGFGGWEAMKQAWKGLAQLATGLVISAVPVAGTLFWTLQDGSLSSWIRDSRTAMKETGKALVAWDEWGKNPARAAGAVTFNVLTTVFTGGAGGAVAGAGKAGAVAKVLSVTGKAIDPMTYIAKGAGAGLSKIGDIATALKGVGNIDIPPLPANAFELPPGSVRLPDGTFDFPEGTALPEGATRLPDGNVRLPEHTVPLPEGTTRLPTEEGAPARYLDPQGNILDDAGNVTQRADEAPREPGGTDLDRPAGADVPHTPTPVREPALVGAGTTDNAAHAAADGPGQTVRLGSDPADVLGDTGRTGDNTTPSVQAGTDVPPVRAGADVPPVLASVDGVPGGNVADNLPTGRSDGLTDGSGTPPHHEGSNEGGHTGYTDQPSTGDGGATPGSGGHETGPVPGAGDPLPPGAAGDLPDTTVPAAPRGNLPDGSWVGENGLRLDPEANAAADDFMRRSQEAEPRITEAMQSVAGRVDNGRLIGLEYRLKGEDSFKRKLATDLLDDVGVDPARVLGDIKDSIRYTMEVPTRNYADGVQRAVDDLQAKGFENVTFKNTWDSPGYKGINSTWRDPVSGQIFELQFHTADSFAAKMDGHVLYEKERLPGVSPDELAAIKLEQSELFGRVPVPHGAGDIRIGGQAAADAASALGRETDAAAGHVDSLGDDVGRAEPETPRTDPHTPERGTDGDGGTGDGPYTDGPNGGWSGAGWVEKPDPINDPDSVVAADMYENIRATDNKVELPTISRHTGVDESVLRQVKSHLFRAQHEVAVGPDTFKKGLFTPRRDIGEMWIAAREGRLSEEGVQQFKHLMAHEFVESRLMQSGLPYIREHPHLWELDPSDGRYYRPQFPQNVHDAGAHDFAPNDKIGGFRHWRSLGMEPPKIELADNLSNLDDVVKAIRQQLRLKGLNL
jgi:hypothetical protein